MLYQLVDKVVVLDKGKIVLEGNKDDVFNQTSLLNEYKIEIPRIVEFIQK